MVALVEKQFQLLITDDNPSFRSVLREVLEDRPFLVLHEAESGEEALEVVQSRRIDIVLLDMHMRLLTGIETLRAMKRLEDCPCDAPKATVRHRMGEACRALGFCRRTPPRRRHLRAAPSPRRRRKLLRAAGEFRRKAPSRLRTIDELPLLRRSP